MLVQFNIQIMRRKASWLWLIMWEIGMLVKIYLQFD